MAGSTSGLRPSSLFAADGKEPSGSPPHSALSSYNSQL